MKELYSFQIFGGMERVYLLGLGALGGMYAARLSDKATVPIKVIAGRDRAERLAHAPLLVNGSPYRFDVIVPGDPEPPADLLIVAVKYQHLWQAIGDMRTFIGKDTVIISLLNGISSEEIIGKEVGMEHLLYAFAIGMDVGRTGMSIQYANAGRIVFGEKKNETLSPRVSAVKELFERAGIQYQVPVDMYRALWSKFMMNVGINQASMILRASYGMLLQNQDARELMLSACREVITLSHKCGLDLNETDIEAFLKVVAGLSPDGKTSMLQDLEAGRKSEVDIFSGVVVEMGKQYGVPTPVNDTFLRIIRVMEGGV